MSDESKSQETCEQVLGKFMHKQFENYKKNKKSMKNEDIWAEFVKEYGIKVSVLKYSL